MTPWLHEDDDCWVAECLVCRTPMVVWRSHGLPEPDLEAALLDRLERIAAERYGGMVTGSTPSGGDSRPLACARAPRGRVLRPRERPLREVLSPSDVTLLG